MGDFSVQNQPPASIAVDTLGGRIHVQWDHTARATPHAQLTFFAEFLATTGVYKDWVDSCPIRYNSPNAPSTNDVAGTLLLAILSGHKRYAHISCLRGDQVSAQILGMKKGISADSMRRALARMDMEQSEKWLHPHLLNSVRPALTTGWILDVDTTIKPIYGHQEGADISYNPHKHGRPSHAIHTYWVSDLRLVRGAVLSPGKEHSADKARPGLLNILDNLAANERPALVRGDGAFGNEPYILALEERNQPYLFKLRQTAKVKKLLLRPFNQEHWS